MITKEELIEILQSTGVPVNEGLSSDKNKTKFPRVVFWEYVWEEIDASDESYKTVVTYQVSVHYNTPRPKELLILRKVLHDKGIRPTMYHEFIEDKKEFHTYFAIDVLENLSA